MGIQALKLSSFQSLNIGFGNLSCTFASNVWVRGLRKRNLRLLSSIRLCTLRSILLAFINFTLLLNIVGAQFDFSETLPVLPPGKKEHSVIVPLDNVFSGKILVDSIKASCACSRDVKVAKVVIDKALPQNLWGKINYLSLRIENRSFNGHPFRIGFLRHHSDVQS